MIFPGLLAVTQLQDYRKTAQRIQELLCCLASLCLHNLMTVFYVYAWRIMSTLYWSFYISQMVQFEFLCAKYWYKVKRLSHLSFLLKIAFSRCSYTLACVYFSLSNWNHKENTPSSCQIRGDNLCIAFCPDASEHNWVFQSISSISNLIEASSTIATLLFWVALWHLCTCLTLCPIYTAC